MSTPEARTLDNQVRCVSVVIAVRDRNELLGRALGSLLPQRELIAEVLVVDDSSTESPQNVVDEFRRNGLPVELLTNQARQGQAGAKNTGLAAATSEFICILDSDDRWLPNHLASVVSTFRNSPEALLVISDFTVHDASSRREPRTNLGTRNDLRLTLRLGQGDLSSSVISMRRVPVAPSFDDNLEALLDYDFVLQGLMVGGVARTQRRTVVKYRQAERVWTVHRSVKARRKIMEKWSREVQSTPFARLFQEWQLAYEESLDRLADSGSKPRLTMWHSRLQYLRLRSRLAREVSPIISITWPHR